METIRNYLESMFAALPNTEDVLRAKQELSQMMEDKYTELISEGKSENEAVGIVISEFGNLDELAESLGLDTVMREQTQDSREVLSSEMANAFLQDRSREALLVGIGVFLCIISPVGCVFAGFSEKSFAAAAGVAILFACIAVAVGLFIYAGLQMKRWSGIAKKRYRLDYGTAAAVRERWESLRSGHALMVVFGVVLCILSVVPVSIAGILAADNSMFLCFGTVLLFVLAGLGVMLLIAGNARKGGCLQLLNLSESGTIGGRLAEDVEDEDVRYENPKAAAVMSVYWPTVTCIYLVVSFLTFYWGRTWIIWPIAAVIHTLLKNLLGTRKDAA